MTVNPFIEVIDLVGKYRYTGWIRFPNFLSRQGVALDIEIGRRLKDLRMMRGFTQKDLAARVSGGLDYTYIGKIERGEQLPSLKMLIGISKALDVTVGYFFREHVSEGNHLFPEDLRQPLAPEKGGELVRAIRLLHPGDFPLIIEIIKALNRHRPDRRLSRKKTDGELLRAAGTYNKAEQE